MSQFTRSDAALNRRRFLQGAFGLTVVGAGLAACSDGTSTSGAAASAAPVRGGRLTAVHVGTSAAADVLDPHVVGHAAGGAVSKNVWDKLVAYNNDLTLRYHLAESLEPNADGTAWRVKLRENAAFSDGTPLTSKDVLYSFERMLDPSRPSSGDLTTLDLRRTKADGEKGVVIALQEPVADLGSILAGWYVYIVKDGAKTFDAKTLPVGTGPFALETWAPGDRTVLKRNEHYWGPAPYLDELVLLQVNERDARMNAFLSREADVIHDLSVTQARQLSTEAGARLVTPPAGTMSGFHMRTDMEPFTDVRVRQAMRLAMNREEMMENVYLGYAVIGNDLYGKGAPFYDAALPQRKHDPAAAKALLKAAGQENLTVTLTTADTGSGMLEAATLFKEQAKQAGITVELETVPADTYFASVAGQKAFTQGGWWNYSLDYFYGQTLTSKSPSNETGWKRPEWDATFTEARASLDPAKRTTLYAELQKELYEEGGSIIPCFVTQPTGVRDTVQGIPQGVQGTDDWANYRGAWVSQA